MTVPRDFPPLADGSYAVVCAEATTGIVLDLAGARALGAAPKYRVFDGLEEAIQQARVLVAKSPLWEAAVLDHAGHVVETFRDERALQQLTAEKKRHKSWWKRWRGE